MASRILERERSAILSSLAMGVVPHIGLHHIQVGRKREIEAVLDDLARIERGASAVRFIVGRFGAGKSFFLSVTETAALAKKFVVVRADITTDRRLHANAGQARALYAALMQSLATRGKPDGGALGNLVERWIGEVEQKTKSAGGGEHDVDLAIAQLCEPLQELVSGHDFAKVIIQYYRGHVQANDALRTAALRWLRGEYPTKTEARRDLDVRTIIDDGSIYDYLKLFAAFVRIAGYAGLLVCLDELVVLSHRLNNKIAREHNYEAILHIVNDCLQGNAVGLGFFFAATDDCITNKRRGLFSYEALESRLASHRFVGSGVVDFSGPLLNLANLTREDCFVLLQNVRRVHALGDESKFILPDKAIEAYLASCEKRMGAAYFQSPRETVKDFVGLLNVLQQNPSANWRNLINEIKTSAPAIPESETALPDAAEDLAKFKV